MHPDGDSSTMTRAKTRKQPTCPSIAEQIKKIRYIYTMEYYSSIRKNEIMPLAATQMDLEIIRPREVSQKEKNTIWQHLYMESKIWQKWTYLWHRCTDIENKCVVTKGEGSRGGKDSEFGISRYQLVYMGWINNRVLLYSTENWTQYPVINHNEKEYMYNRGTLLHCRN